jgi:hypothetical protein
MQCIFWKLDEASLRVSCNLQSPLLSGHHCSHACRVVCCRSDDRPDILCLPYDFRFAAAPCFQFPEHCTLPQYLFTDLNAPCVLSQASERRLTPPAYHRHEHGLATRSSCRGSCFPLGDGNQFVSHDAVREQLALQVPCRRERARLLLSRLIRMLRRARVRASRGAASRAGATARRSLRWQSIRRDDDRARGDARAMAAIVALSSSGMIDPS